MPTPELKSRLAAIVAPLEEEAAALDVEIAKVEKRLAALKDDRRSLDGILARANGTYVKPGKKTGHVPQTGKGLRNPPSQEDVDYVREFLGRGVIDRDRIQIKGLYTAMAGDARRNGRKHLGYNTVGAIVALMHQNGELRLRQKRGRGGTLIYAKLAG